jgi:hypothetical protein
LHNEELHILFSSRNIIRQIISRTMRWAGHVALMREERKVYRVSWKRPKERGHLEDPRHRWEDGITVDLREIGSEMWSGSSWLRIGASDRLL